MLYNWSIEDNCLQNLSKGISLLFWWASHHLSAYVTVCIHVLTYLNVYWIDLRSSSINPYSLATMKIPITQRSNFWDLVWAQEKLVLIQNWPQLQYFVLQKPFQYDTVFYTSHHQYQIGLQLILLGLWILISHHNQPLFKLTAFVGSSYTNLLESYKQPQPQKFSF